MNSRDTPITKQAMPAWLGVGGLVRKARVAGGTLKQMKADGDLSFRRLRELYNGGNRSFGASAKAIARESHRNWLDACSAFDHAHGMRSGLGRAELQASRDLLRTQPVNDYHNKLNSLWRSADDAMTGAAQRMAASADMNYGINRSLRDVSRLVRREARKAGLVRNAVNTAGITGAAGAVGLGGYALGSDTKAAEAQLEKQAQLKKILSEALVRSPKTTLKRLHVAMSPKVDPTKLNKFTRFFTKTRQHTTIPFGSVKSTFVGGPAGDYSVAGSGIYDGVLNGTSRATTRLAPGRIAAALGLAGGTGYLGSSALSGSKSSPSDKVRDAVGGAADKARGFTDDAMTFVKAHPAAVIATALGVPLLTAAAIKAFSGR